MRWNRLLLSAFLVLMLAGCAEQPDGGRPVTVRDEPAALRVLQKWDDARAKAWATADLSALRSLYVRGAEAGVRDAAMLAAWRDRGLRVRSMQTQVLAVRVLDDADDRLVLVVTDRIVSAVATGRGQVARLPVDRPTTRKITLRRRDGAWRVSSVLPVAAQS